LSITDELDEWDEGIQALKHLREVWKRSLRLSNMDEVDAITVTPLGRLGQFFCLETNRVSLNLVVGDKFELAWVNQTCFRPHAFAPLRLVQASAHTK
jgi:hypothetical protein